MKQATLFSLLTLAMLVFGYATPLHAATTLVPVAQDAPTPTPAAEEAAEAAGETDLAEQLALLAQLNPPPRLSDRPLGMTTVPCDFAALSGPDEVEGETYSCGIFTVPQNWDDPTAGKLDLFFMVAKATGENPLPDPLLFLAGGPGQSSVITSLDAYDEIRPTRDIVRMDQRGAGLSQRLDINECLALAAGDENALKLLAPIVAPSADADADDDSPSLRNQLCWDLFAKQGIDLNQFTTAVSARDLVELMKALGYESYNVHGISYGTRLAMTLMAGVPGVEDAPALRSVVLDSAFPPSVRLLSTIPSLNHELVVQMLEECDSDDACRTAYPNLKQRLSLLLERLAAAPLVVAGQTVTVTDVAAQLTDLTGLRAGFMPRLIAELEAGVLDTYLALRNREVGVDPTEGFDLSDPVQAFLAQALSLAAQSGDDADMFEFLITVSTLLAEEDPLPAIQAYITDSYADETRDQLLALAAALTPDEIAASPMVQQMRATKAANASTAPATEEEAAAAEMAQARKLALISVASLLNTNIHCNEDYQFERVEDAINTYNDLLFPQLANMESVGEQALTCVNWPVVAAPIEVKNPVSSTVPTLILQGLYDVKTPVTMGRRAARELVNSTLVLIPRQGHEVWKRTNTCAGQIATAFVLDPEQALDLACLEAQRPRWALPAAAEILSRTWQLVEIQYMDDTVKTPADSSQYTLTLKADGSFAAQLDCNNATGSYTLAGNQLRFADIAATMAMCPGDSLADRYAVGLRDATSFVGEAGDLFIPFGPDAGILHFTPLEATEE